MKLLAIDGNSILNRAFYGIKLLSTKEGVYTNAVYGFINILFKLLEREQPDCVAVCFDLKAPTFRHQKYEGYKAGRKPMPDELRSQFPLIKQWLTLAGYHVVEKEGFEADDIIGTLSHAAQKSGNSCVIATGDRDAFQLINGEVKVLLSSTKLGRPELTVCDEAYLMEAYGLTPAQMIDLKAVMGDTSDKIPGVPGIGEKGGLSLIKRFGSLDAIYENIDSADITPAIKNKLVAGKDSAYLSKFLGTICLSTPVDTNISTYKITPPDTDSLRALMTKLELFKQLSLMNLEPALTVEKEAETVDFALGEFCDLKGEVLDIYADYENNALAVFDGKTACCAELFAEGRLTDAAKAIFESEAKKRPFNAKPLYKTALENSVELKNVIFDTTLAAYLDNPSATEYNLERIASAVAVSVSAQSDSEAIKNAVALDKVNRKLNDLLNEKGQEELLHTIELPLCRVLAEMEFVGVKVETEQITAMGEELSDRIKELQNRIYQSIGWEFNINSPKQLGEALFEKLGLPAKKKTQRGYSTSAEVLEELRYAHEAVDMILEYRGLAKLKSTYCDGLAAAVAPDGRIHTTFNQTETRTGRISSLEPNLQNIPVRKPEGKKLRKFFVAEPGYCLVDADYSQIELRVLAAMADDGNMIKAFNEDRDIHTATAGEVFGLPVDMITPVLRSRAKAVNFGIVYGIGAFSLSKDIGVTRKEADTYIKNYLTVYSGVDRFMRESIENAREQGYVTTLFGRRRYLPELSNSNHMIRSFGERVARNAPIQGTAADIIKLAMINVDRRIKREKLPARLILQVHDELILECRDDVTDKVAELLKQEMEAAVTLKVKLVADVAHGKSWYEAKE